MSHEDAVPRPGLVLIKKERIPNTPRNVYPYEPDRLIRDGHGHIIEQDLATLKYKLAESRSAIKAARRSRRTEAAEWAARTRMETELFGAWLREQEAKGRQDRLTFGDFVREMGILR